jgi:hypothetical protein
MMRYTATRGFRATWYLQDNQSTAMTAEDTCCMQLPDTPYKPMLLPAAVVIPASPSPLSMLLPLCVQHKAQHCIEVCLQVPA